RNVAYLIPFFRATATYGLRLIGGFGLSCFGVVAAWYNDQPLWTRWLNNGNGIPFCSARSRTICGIMDRLGFGGVVIARSLSQHNRRILSHSKDWLTPYSAARA